MVKESGMLRDSGLRPHHVLLKVNGGIGDIGAIGDKKGTANKIFVASVIERFEAFHAATDATTKNAIATEINNMHEGKILRKAGDGMKKKLQRSTGTNSWRILTKDEAIAAIRHIFSDTFISNLRTTDYINDAVGRGAIFSRNYDRSIRAFQEQRKEKALKRQFDKAKWDCRRRGVLNGVDRCGNVK